MGATIFWLITGCIVFAIDILTSNFCFVLLSAGSIAAAIGAGFGMEFIIQVTIYAVVNIISVSVGYPWLKKKYKKILINMQKVCNFIHNNDIIISRKRWFRILNMEVSTCIGGISLEGCKV